MKGVIYILTNPSFPDYVKIGYADDVDVRLKQLNRSECTPFAFRVYATYEVDKRLQDLKIHEMIDCINPNLRSIETINDKKRVREFYALSPEDAFSIFKAIAEISGQTDRLRLYEMSEEQREAEEFAQEVKEEDRQKKIPFTFDMVGIKPGDKIKFNHYNNEHNGEEFVVYDSKNIVVDGVPCSLSATARKLLNSKWPVQGPLFFEFNGKKLIKLREETWGF